MLALNLHNLPASAPQALQPQACAVITPGPATVLRRLTVERKPQCIYLSAEDVNFLFHVHWPSAHLHLKSVCFTAHLLTRLFYFFVIFVYFTYVYFCVFYMYAHLCSMAYVWRSENSLWGAGSHSIIWVTLTHFRMSGLKGHFSPLL